MGKGLPLLYIFTGVVTYLLSCFVTFFDKNVILIFLLDLWLLWTMKIQGLSYHVTNNSNKMPLFKLTVLSFPVWIACSFQNTSSIPVFWGALENAVKGWSKESLFSPFDFDKHSWRSCFRPDSSLILELNMVGFQERMLSPKGSLLTLWQGRQWAS